MDDAPPTDPAKRRRVDPTPSSSSTLLFNDPSTADVILHIQNDAVSSSDQSAASQLQLHLHSSVLRRSNYFAALLSNRWQQQHQQPQQTSRVNLVISPNTTTTGNISNYITVLQLLYTNDYTATITSVSTALSLIPIALQLLCEDCVTACCRFLESVPWTEDEEKHIINVSSLLTDDESRQLLARVRVCDDNNVANNSELSRNMMYGLIVAAIHNHPNTAYAKAFVAKMLREFATREEAGEVLGRVFLEGFKVVRESLEEYSRPDFRGDSNETEAIQRLHLHTAMKSGRSLLWLIERMIELGVAGRALEEWTNLGSFTADLQRAFRDEAWRNIVPGLPGVVLRCTCKLANAVAAGSILAPRQVRMKLVEDWLPVLTVCKENVSPVMANYKSLYLELEEVFLMITSTLPLSDAQELLQKCLSFSTRNVDDCPHLVTAFNTWFCRAKQLQPQQQAEN